MPGTNYPPHADGWLRTLEQLPPPGQSVLLSDGLMLEVGVWKGLTWQVGPRQHAASEWPYWRFAPPLPHVTPTEET